ncbi:hypothetical protein PAL_GLEAN10019395 [Pteropus alecto]|uniref:Uncharacterized protein n=1 Tax=Pteropus alecto TaxID=9402 RepID=L5JSN9_PTEAL|nr:hypothetical protein PAL_GLEAN10019395 [Pteropus alecto]
MSPVLRLRHPGAAAAGDAHVTASRAIGFQAATADSGLQSPAAPCTTSGRGSGVGVVSHQRDTSKASRLPRERVRSQGVQEANGPGGNKVPLQKCLMAEVGSGVATRT